jgi:hypothetical protein
LKYVIYTDSMSTHEGILVTVSKTFVLGEILAVPIFKTTLFVRKLEIVHLNNISAVESRPVRQVVLINLELKIIQ